MSLKVGIIGTGVMGTQHAHLLAREVRGCEVVAIADINSARVSQIAHDLAIAATYQDGLDLIRSATVEAVLPHPMTRISAWSPNASDTASRCSERNLWRPLRKSVAGWSMRR